MPTIETPYEYRLAEEFGNGAAKGDRTAVLTRPGLRSHRPDGQGHRVHPDEPQWLTPDYHRMKT
jgi:hypothetical protein